MIEVGTWDEHHCRRDYGGAEHEPVCTFIRTGRQPIDKGHKDHENDNEAEGQGCL